jgi:acyl-CoA reductase-like NAD-dependent aldehyde dehydrogenase
VISISEVENAKLGLFIDGSQTVPLSGRYLDSYDPATGQVWYTVADSGEEDVDRAIASAQRAFSSPGWRRMTQTARGDLLRRLSDLIRSNVDRLAEIESRDNGKLLRDIRSQILYVAEIFNYFGGMADKVQGDTIPINRQDMLSYTVREPLGIVGAIVPWNSPLYLLSCSLAPSLAVGNAVVAKPSEHTSASSLALAELVIEAGFPPGIFNVVTGYGRTTGEALTSHHAIAKLAFIGGTQTGKKIAANLAGHLVPASLELGGKSPHVVFDDANLDRAVNGILAGIFAAAGQTCVAGSRCFVQESVYDEVMDRLIPLAQAVRVGHPNADSTQVGPLALHSQLEKVSSYVDLGKAAGAKLLVGGDRPNDPELGEGWYFSPTIFTDVQNEMQIAREEIFGPVASVLTFKNESDLLQKANDTSFGLASGVWTRDIDRALRFARDVDAGTVWVNTYRTASFTTPAGGFKSSGYGKHNGFDAIREYSRSKSVIIDYSGDTQDAFIMRDR